MMPSKKYYSISEVMQLLGVKAHILRYADHLLGSKLVVIRGRRHYKISDIEIIRAYLIKNSMVSKTAAPDIDNLINLFRSLKVELVGLVT